MCKNVNFLGLNPSIPSSFVFILIRSFPTCEGLEERARRSSAGIHGDVAAIQAVRHAMHDGVPEPLSKPCREASCGGKRKPFRTAPPPSDA